MSIARAKRYTAKELEDVFTTHVVFLGPKPVEGARQVKAEWAARGALCRFEGPVGIVGLACNPNWRIKPVPLPNNLVFWRGVEDVLRSAVIAVVTEADQFIMGAVMMAQVAMSDIYSSRVAVSVRRY